MTTAARNGYFAMALKKRMDKVGMTITDVANGVESSEAHIKKALLGTALPSRFLLQSLAHLLDVDSRAWEKLIEADRIEIQNLKKGDARNVEN